MKLKEIETGKRYVVQIPPRVDQVVAEQSDGGRVVAAVEAVGESYDVETYTASRVRGCGFTRTHESDKASQRTRTPSAPDLRRVRVAVADFLGDVVHWLEGADEGSCMVEDSEYEVVAWDVSTGGAS